jgi:hypothetical protein
MSSFIQHPHTQNPLSLPPMHDFHLIAPVPVRLRQGPDALAFMKRIKLPRLHRHIFFLLDGQRNTNDLARLMGHPLEEIQHLLTDLQRIGLITLETPSQ